ncbi:MAG: amidase, partial [Nitrospinaceae bacterium]|nr:amidase [Nitrospinaceae bacterium]
MSNLWELTLSEGIKKISQGLLTTTEWTEALLTRIDVCEERIHAWTALDKQGALDSAKQLDASHSEPGPLTGAQIGVKDIINVKGLPCEANSPILKGVIPNEDAHCVARLREAGAVIMGKTVTTQFATGDPSETRNPWNLAHSPGGSSSGSAAAVATGMVPAALGSQTGGSVLRPSAYCG